VTEAWSDFHLRFSRLRPPQAVTADMAARMAAAVAGHDERVLLLGVTPALTEIGRSLVAVDRSIEMIRRVWPGNDRRRQVLQADWRSMELDGEFTAVIGDGSFNCLHHPDDYTRVWARIGRMLRRGGRIGLRFFVTPEACESLDDLVEATRAGRVESAHALKWRLAMAMAAESGKANVPAIDILAEFNRRFPQRLELVQLTGWAADDIGLFDAYERSSDVISFPTLGQIKKTIPPGFSDMRLLPSGDYDLAERCPLLTMNRDG